MSDSALAIETSGSRANVKCGSYARAKERRGHQKQYENGIEDQNSTQNVNFARKFRSHYVFGVVSAHEFKQKDREFVIRDPFFIRKMEIKRVFHTNSLSSIHALSPIFQ